MCDKQKEEMERLFESFIHTGIKYGFIHWKVQFDILQQ